jgi:GAF domain-containing protein
MSSYEFLDWPDDIKGLTVVDGEFVVATADGADRGRDQPVADLLQRVREGLGMDIVFISQFAGDERVIRHVAPADGDSDFVAGERDPLEETFCHEVVLGRQPPLSRTPPASTTARADARRRVGAYITVPISAPGGTVFGTLCCISHAPKPQLGNRSELEAMQSVAQLLSSVLARGD